MADTRVPANLLTKAEPSRRIPGTSTNASNLHHADEAFGGSQARACEVLTGLTEMKADAFTACAPACLAMMCDNAAQAATGCSPCSMPANAELHEDQLRRKVWLSHSWAVSAMSAAAGLLSSSCAWRPCVIGMRIVVQGDHASSHLFTIQTRPIT